MFALVKNGEVQEFGSIPDATDRISGFQLLTDAERATHGFVEIIEIKPSLKDGEAYGEPSTIVGEDGSVTKTFPIVQLGKAEADAALQAAKDSQIASLNSGYEAAILAPVSFTNAAGVAASYSSDQKSIDNLQKCITAFAKAKNFKLNLWLDVNGTPITPFTYDDLQGLADAIGSADVPQFTHLLEKVGAVNAAKTVSDVQSVIW